MGGTLKIIKKEDSSKLIFTWSENPSIDLWNHIMFLSKKSNVSNLLSGKIQSNRTLLFEQGDALEKKAKQISLSVNQAYEYFKAADSITIATKPLLYFYGMLSLAKSLIIANTKETNLESLDYHGLTQKPRDKESQEYHENPQNWTLEKEYAATAPGDFSKAVSDFEFPNGSIILFKDILAICPEISSLYELYYKEPSHTLYMYSYEEKSSAPFVFELSFEPENEKETFRRIPEFEKEFSMLPQLKHGVARTFRSKELEQFPEYMGIYHPPVGGQYVVRGINYRVDSKYYSRYIDPIVVDYLGMYMLSMCVRYKQELWGDSTQGERTGIASLIELYLTIVKRRFPNGVLNLFFGIPFWYGAPSYIS